MGVDVNPPSPPPRESSRARLWVVLALGLLFLAPIAVVWVVSNEGSGGAAGSEFKPLASSPSPPSAAPAQRPTLTTLPPGPGALVALVEHPTTVRARPGGRALAPLGLHTPFGSAQALWVLRRTAAWLGIGGPMLGNGRIGWIPRAAVRLMRDPWSLHVSLSSRALVVLDAGRSVERYRVAVGAPGAPTPSGRFDVTDRLLTGDPAGPYGCCVLALSAVAPHAIQGWTGETGLRFIPRLRHGPSASLSPMGAYD